MVEAYITALEDIIKLQDKELQERKYIISKLRQQVAQNQLEITQAKEEISKLVDECMLIVAELGKEHTRLLFHCDTFDSSTIQES